MRPQHRYERGSALFVAVLLLVMMGALGLAALDTISEDRQVAGFQNRALLAFYAAEAGAAQARYTLRTVGSRSDQPAFPTQNNPTTLGDATIYPFGLPRFYGDPAYSAPIRYVRDGGVYASGGNLRIGGQQRVNTLWQINVVGESPDGSKARIEVMERRVLSRGY